MQRIGLPEAKNSNRKADCTAELEVGGKDPTKEDAQHKEREG